MNKIYYKLCKDIWLMSEWLNRGSTEFIDRLTELEEKEENYDPTSQVQMEKECLEICIEELVNYMKEKEYELPPMYRDETIK